MILKAKAFAKLNLFLDIVGKRENGYHDIDSVMQSVDLYDEIEAELSHDGTVTITYEDTAFFRSDDIIFKACETFFDYSGCNFGVNLYIKKNIPTVAGVGGFSSDVAVVLKMLNILSGKNYSNEEMLSLCLRLGADIPFCFNGGTARVRGVGEKLEKLPTPKLSFVLIKEGEKQSTGQMYAKLDLLSLTPSDKIEKMLSGIEENNLSKVTSSVYNAFEYCWDMGSMKKTFEPFAPDAVFLSGSGPTVVAAFTDTQKSRLCYSCLHKEGRNVFYADSVSTGNIIE